MELPFLVWIYSTDPALVHTLVHTHRYIWLKNCFHMHALTHTHPLTEMLCSSLESFVKALKRCLQQSPTAL